MATNCEPRSEPRRKRARHGNSVRYQMDFYFASDDAKQGFLRRVDSAKSRLAPKGAAPLDSRELLSSLLDRLEATPPSSSATSQLDRHAQTVPSLSLLDHSGVCIAMV